MQETATNPKIDTESPASQTTGKIKCAACDFRDDDGRVIVMHGRDEHPGMIGPSASGFGMPQRIEAK